MYVNKNAIRRGWQKAKERTVAVPRVLVGDSHAGVVELGQVSSPATVDITFSDSDPLGMTLEDDVEEGEPPVRISAREPGGQAEKLGAPIDSIVVAINGMDMLKTARLKMLEVIAAEKAKGPVTFTVKLKEERKPVLFA